MKKNCYNVILLMATALFCSASLCAQTPKTPITAGQTQSGWIIQAIVGGSSPMGDLSKRFGNSGEVGAGLAYKTASGWLFGLDGTFIFGNKVKEDPLYNLRTSEGIIVTQDGTPSTLNLQQRGFKAPFVKVGKIFHRAYGRRASANSGFLLQVGGGFLQHKIRYEKVSGGDVGQLSSQYQTGYNRLCNGFALSESVGYMSFSNRKGLNCYIGLELMQGFTQAKYIDFDTRQKDPKNRLDGTISLKFIWLLPILQRDEQEEYYY